MGNTLKLAFGGIFVLIIGMFLGTLLILYVYMPAVEELPSSLNIIGPHEKSVLAKFVAVDEQGRGVVADLITEIRPGTGLVLVNINNILADINTQYSARIAAQVASNFTKINLKNVDVIYNLKTEASLVGGQSAGTIMAISTIAALRNTTLKDGVIATGSVNAAGEIVDAGALIAKATAAKDSNFSLFLVPEGLGTNHVEFKRQKYCTMQHGLRYCSVDYVGDEVSIGDGLGIVVKEVKTVAEAWRYFEL
ncbi:MAG: S16 family serine protease [Nanoarchaeota archaeon]